MRFLSMVKSSENQGHPPEALQDAMAKLIQDSLKDGSLIQTGGLGAGAQGVRFRISKGKITMIDGPYAESKEVVGGYAVMQFASKQAAVEATRRFMELHQKHWPGWEGECELREVMFLAP